jgi:futalosine hydrolase
MKILLTAATLFEIRPFINRLREMEKENGTIRRFQFRDHEIDVLIPGIGMMNTAFQLGKAFSAKKYDLALNAGIAGAYDLSIPVGTVVDVMEDCVSELGAEDQDQFLSVFDLGLTDPDKFPYQGGRLVNTLPVRGNSVLERLQKVKGNTVNTIHADKISIERILMRVNARIESMEGAAFLYSCLLEQIPNAQVRAVSNYVEERDKSKWDIELALKNLNQTLFLIMKEGFGK